MRIACYIIYILLFVIDIVSLVQRQIFTFHRYSQNGFFSFPSSARLKNFVLLAWNHPDQNNLSFNRPELGSTKLVYNIKILLNFISEKVDFISSSKQFIVGLRCLQKSFMISFITRHIFMFLQIHKRYKIHIKFMNVVHYCVKFFENTKHAKQKIYKNPLSIYPTGFLKFKFKFIKINF